MIRLNRATEYALISMFYMSKKSGGPESGVATAREISGRYELPYEITAKTLQRLKNRGYIRSFQGAQGGYVLAKPLTGVNFAEFLTAMEGNEGVVACCHADAESGTEPVDPACAYQSKCEVRPFMVDLNSRIFNFLAGISLGDLEASGADTGDALAAAAMTQTRTDNDGREQTSF